ncbi:MAG: T9SS type A sorting domain-containing protein [Ignavibacteriales bacterium]|nr:T9SS type A sorting domain-containing protein [Ignavibacteriales bacterium]
MFTTVTGTPGLVYDLPLTVTDNAGGTANLKFGIAPDATDGIDAQYGEQPLPPAPPAGVFDARFNLPVNNEASLKDYRQGAANTTLRRLHEVQYQVGNGTTITFNWNLPAGITDTLKDLITGTIVNVPMTGTGSYTLTNPGVITKLQLVANYSGSVVNPPPTPVLVSPVNNATGVAVNPTLVWRKSLTATSYHLQVSTDDSFTTFVVNDSTLTDTLKAISGLANNTTYFWRTRAKNAGGVSAFNPAPFMFTTVTGTPGLVYDLPLTVTDNAGGTANLKFGIAPDATDGIDGQYGEAPLPPAPPTGVFDARFNLPVNNEASLKDYRQGAANTMLRKVHEVQYQVGNGTTMTFSWNLPAGITDTLKDLITGTIVNVPMTGIGSYTLTNPGVITKLQLIANYNGSVVVPPVAPVLATPTNNATGVSVNPTLTWNAATGATSYRLIVARDTGFTNVVFNDSTLSGVSKQLSGLLYNTKYYWKVNAKNSAGTSAYSPSWLFTTELQPVAPAAPVLTTPANNAMNIPLTTTLIWQASATATSYRVQVASDAAFTQMLVNDSTVTATSRIVGPLAADTKFYWRVYAKNTAGVSPASTVFNFTTIPSTNLAFDFPLTITDSAGGTLELRYGLAPAATDGIDTLLGENILPPLPPTGVFDARFNLPVGGEASLKDYRFGRDTTRGTKVHHIQYQVGAGTKITLNWALPSSAVGLLQDEVTGQIINVPMIGAGSFTVTNPNAITGLKMSISYLGEVTKPLAPKLVSPDSASTGVTTSPTFVWRKSAGALLYRLMVSKNLTFTSLVVNDSTLTDTMKQVTGLTNGTKYYWKVNATNSAGTSPFSTTYNFTTAAAPAGVPVLVSPVNNAVNQALSLNLKWLKVTGATKYHVQIGRDTTAFEISDSAVVDTFKQVGLKEVLTYYWRVRASNGSSWSAFSNMFHFRTLLKAPDTLQVSTVLNVKVVNLKWRNNSGTNPKFVIERKSTGAFSVVATTASGAITYSDSSVSLGQSYTYRVRAVAGEDSSAYSNESTTIIVSVGPNKNELPTQFGLEQNYPNPFNPATRIEFALPVEAKVVVEVYSTLGEKVATLVNTNMAAGNHGVTFDARNLNSGMYIVRLEAKSAQQNFVQVRKMILMK